MRESVWLVFDYVKIGNLHFVLHLSIAVGQVNAIRRPMEMVFYSSSSILHMFQRLSGAFITTCRAKIVKIPASLSQIQTNKQFEMPANLTSVAGQ